MMGQAFISDGVSIVSFPSHFQQRMGVMRVLRCYDGPSIFDGNDGGA